MLANSISASTLPVRALVVAEVHFAWAFGWIDSLGCAIIICSYPSAGGSRLSPDLNHLEALMFAKNRSPRRRPTSPSSLSKNVLRPRPPFIRRAR